MGCISSKLRAEDVVGRCKTRKKLMKQAVEQRHGFAAAHAAYLQALRNTGAALRQFAEGEKALPACGQGPFTRIPEPPPLPPGLGLLAPPINVSHAGDSLPANLVKGPSLDSPAAIKAWDFFEPFDPAEPPLHLQEQRKRSEQALPHQEEADNMQDVSEVDDTQDFSKVDERQPDCIVDEGTSQQSVVAETHVQSSPKQPTNEQTDAGSVELELGLMLRLNVKKDLLEIVRDLDEEFLKASAGGADVAQSLEARKPHVHTDLPRSKFRNYNSARVFSALPWNWSRSPLPTKEEVDINLNESGRNASHALTLERLLAWEKKLFEEVKVLDSLRIEREKKCSSLRHQETRGEDASEIEKTRAEIKRLHSLILISYQGVDSTIEAIEDLRDDELHPQLVGLIGGLMSMWVTMHRCHARQTQIIIHIKNLDAMMSQEPTSELHHQATIQLEKELHGWHESFCKLVATQRGYMAALYGWLKLSLKPIPTGKEKKRASEDEDEEREQLETYRLCEEWQRALGCLPDKVASEAIKSLAEVVKAMVGKQAEEMKQKRKAEKMEKQWEKKVHALQPLEEEEEEKRGRELDGEQGRAGIMPAIGLTERRAALAAMKKKVEGEMMKHCRAVQDTRVLTMNNLQTGLPGVLEAMTGFSAVCSQAFQHLNSLTTYPLNL